MSERLCPACQNWRQAPQENFCGLCGSSFLDLQASSPDAFTFAGQGSGEPRSGEIAFLLDSAKLPDEPIEVALTIDQTRQEIRRQAARDPGGSRDGWVAVHFDVDEIQTAQVATGRLVHLAPSGRAARTLAEFGMRLPEPRVGLAEREVLLTEADLQRGRIRFSLVCEAGQVAPIEELEFAPPDSRSAVDLQVEPTPPMPLRPLVLRRGDAMPVDVQLKRNFASLLRERPAGVIRTLSVRYAGLDLPVVVGGVTFRLDKPAQPEFAMPSRLFAMRGADFCLPVVLRNAGAAPLALGEVKLLALDGEGEPAAAVAVRDLSGTTVAGGEEFRYLLEVEARTADILGRAGTATVRLSHGFADAGLPRLERDMTLTVREPKTFDGAVAIDFGTTESAAAILANDGGAPESLQIGDEGFFVPTVVAYGGKAGAPGLQFHVGAKARNLARERTAAELAYFDNIKWELSKPEAEQELPNGDRVTWIRITADYLREIKRRVEGHPSVAARLERAFVTRPARFDDRAVGALLMAFRQAGIEPQPLPAVGYQASTVSESWPPSILGFARAELNDLRRDAIDQEHSIFGEDPTGRQHELLTVDVGGGSCDISLFSVDYADFARIVVHERMMDGDHTICGNQVSEWIYRHVLRPALVEGVAKHGFGPDEIPTHFVWKGASKEQADRRRERNGLAIAAEVRRIQSDDGPFRKLLDGLRGHFATIRKEAAEELDLPEGLSETAAFGDWLFAGETLGNAGRWEAMARAWEQVAYEPQPVTFETKYGDVVELTWRPGALAIDFAAAMPAFDKLFRVPLQRYVESFAAACAPSREQPVQVLISGRGSLFPLLDELIKTSVRAALDAKHQKAVVVRSVLPDLCKPITSMGACYIADFVVQDPENLRFFAQTPNRLALLGGVAPDDPSKRVAKPVPGALRPELGIAAIPHPLPRGTVARRIEFVMVADEETSVPSDRPRALPPLSEPVEVPATTGGETFVVVRAVEGEANGSGAAEGEKVQVGLAIASGVAATGCGEEDFDFLHWFAPQSLPRGH